MKNKNVYMVGIKGVAMTAMAVYFKEAGLKVTGSDVPEQFYTDAVLEKFKIPFLRGFSAQNINKKYGLVIVTGAHGGLTNPEASEAQKLGIPTYMHGQYLGILMRDHIGISVAGSHGKTTTSALVASILSHARLDPSYAVGTAYINDLGAGGHFGKGKYFVSEADEYMTCPVTNSLPRFLWQKPKIIIITNIEYDHPDAYSSLEKLKKAFISFSENLSGDGVVIACLDDKNTSSILPKIKNQKITYGFTSSADYKISKFYFGENVSFMQVTHGKVNLGEFMIKISGKHNLLNALAAALACHQLGMSWESIRQNLKYYTGANRRFEKIYSKGKFVMYDDYAHHPSEISATISAFKSWYPGKKLVVIFQPHTYSRTMSLLSEFAKSFTAADNAVITDIYPSARETVNPGINSEMLVNKANYFKKNTVYKKDKNAVLSYLKNTLKGDEVLVTMGAGDLFSWHPDMIKLVNN